MNTVAPATAPLIPTVAAQRDFHQRLSQATRRRRQAAGRYPTKAQKKAIARSYRRDGIRDMTAADMLLLSTHPHLLESQRTEYAKRHEAATATVAA